jgi:hypothetical protein
LWHFENDPQYAWVPEIVEECSEHGEIILREALYDRMIAEQAATLGPYPETEYRVAAMCAVLDANLSNLSVFESRFTQDMLGILQDVWPQKFDRMGAAVLENACTCWREKARTEFQYSTVETQACHSGLLYARSRFLAQPLVRRRASETTECGKHRRRTGRTLRTSSVSMQKPGRRTGRACDCGEKEASHKVLGSLVLNIALGDSAACGATDLFASSFPRRRESSASTSSQKGCKSKNAALSRRT